MTQPHPGVGYAVTLTEALASGLAHHRAGRLAEAEAVYRQVLAHDPDQPQALHLLGLIAHACGHRDDAEALIRRAISLRPEYPEAWLDLGAALRAWGRPDEAAACYRRALELRPVYPEAYNNLGNVLKDKGDHAAAAGAYRRAIALRPDYPEALNNLGVALAGERRWEEAITSYRQALACKSGYAEALNNLGVALAEQLKFGEAIACYRQALELQPNYPEAHYNLGNALRGMGDLSGAVDRYRRAAELRPDYPEPHNNLGNALKDLGRLTEAVACYRRALALRPDSAEVHNNLGLALAGQGLLDEAAATFRHSLDLDPRCAQTHNNLGNAMKEAGELEAAIACYRQAMALDPDYPAARDNLILALHYLPGPTPEEILQEAIRFDRHFGGAAARLAKPHTNGPDPERRLRVGYVSPDFRDHPVGRFLLPLLECHDRQRYEVFCYDDVLVPDGVTERIRGCAGEWRRLAGLTDEEVADLVRRDGIDVLIDLASHFARNRLLAFARRPAPVQVTYLAYPGTTGLSAVDYRLTDPHLDSPGRPEAEYPYAERSVWLPRTYWCYRPPDDAPPVGPPPAAASSPGGQVTFGCLSNFCKVNGPLLRCWARVLGAVPGSRLLLHAPEGEARGRVLRALGGCGVGPERVRFAGKLPLGGYLAAYGGVDVALDTRPYGGGTTTCDALWMGVPVVSLAGETAVGRAGASILANVGLGELVARDEDQYVRLAAGLASDPARLAGLRAAMRERMLASPLMDAAAFARDVEGAYRWMWRRWCEGKRAATTATGAAADAGERGGRP